MAADIVEDIDSKDCGKPCFEIVLKEFNVLRCFTNIKPNCKTSMTITYTYFDDYKDEDKTSVNISITSDLGTNSFSFSSVPLERILELVYNIPKKFELEGDIEPAFQLTEPDLNGDIAANIKFKLKYIIRYMNAGNVLFGTPQDLKIKFSYDKLLTIEHPFSKSKITINGLCTIAEILKIQNIHWTTIVMHWD